MRTLNDYFISLGNIDLGGSSDTSNIVCVPDGGELIGVSYNTSEAIDVLGTADLFIDGADQNTGFVFPITAVDTGGLAQAETQVFVPDNTSIQLQSQDQPGTGIIDCTLIVRR